MSEPSGIPPKIVPEVGGTFQQKSPLQESPIAVQMTSKGRY